MTKYTRPDHTSQSLTSWKSNLDNSAAVFEQGAGDNFQPHEQETPNMTIRLEAGLIWDASTLTEVSAQNTGTIVAPSSDPRIDRVVIDTSTGAVSVITGTESATPSAPAFTSSKFPICQILLATTSTSIVDTMLTDERVPFVNISGSGETNTVSNVGGGTGIYKQKVSSDLELKTLTSTDSTISLTGSTSTVDLSIGTVDLDDLNAVTIAGASKGDILAYNGSAWVDLTVGSNDQVLTADSAEATGIKWAAPAGGGAWQVLSHTSVSSATATIDITSGFSASYNTYKLVIRNLRTVSDADVYLRCSDDGGSTYESSASAYKYTVTTETNSEVVENSTGAAQIHLTGWEIDSGDAVSSYNAELTFFNETGDAEYFYLRGQAVGDDSGGSQINQYDITGRMNHTATVDGIRLLASSGNIDHAEITLLGMNQS